MPYDVLMLGWRVHTTMPPNFRRAPSAYFALFWTMLLIAACELSGQCDTPASGSVAGIEFFETHIRPVLVARCYVCHNATQAAQGGLALDSRTALLKGGSGGIVLVPGQPDKSRLLAVMEHTLPGLEMPKGAPKLTAGILADFRKWIAMGAPDPRTKAPSPPSATATSSAAASTSSAAWAAQLVERKKWWSFQPIRNVTPPVVSGSVWASHPVDKFVLAELVKNGIKPAATAEPPTLVRRLFFTLTGLPPSPGEMTQWTERLKHPGGYAALVDDLLARPQFGEAWARHWMDWTRYADSYGSEGDPDIQNGWLYRDYLIRALNADVGYDQLVREHIAGDLLAKPRINTALGINESMIGPAHWRMVFHGFSPTDALDEKVRFTDDQVNTFSKAFLGLTVACARCHNHKFDAISQRDYYALFGVLASCRPGRSVIDLPEKQDRNRQPLTALKPKIKAAIADTWLQTSARLRQRLNSDRGSDPALWKEAASPDSILHPLFALQSASGDKARSREAWQQVTSAWKMDRQSREEQTHRSYKQRWDLTREADYRAWFRQGNGLPDKPSSPGEFALATTGDNMISGIYPAGVYTHLLSPRQAARLSSGYVRLDGDYELWARVIGDGGASLRYVIQNYPRDGTVYPVSRLTPQWQWQRFDLTYWNSDEMHVELAAGKDAPVMANNEAASWFGIRDVLVMKKGEKAPPANSQEALDSLFELKQNSNVLSSPTLAAPILSAPSMALPQLVNAYVETILSAVKAWRDGSATDAQSHLLAQCVSLGLLPNTMTELPTAKPLIAEYRRLEAEIETPTRVPGLEEAIVRNQPLYERGDHKHPAAEVPRAFLEAIDATPYPKNQSGRLQLAENLLRSDNPLTRRVIVNRLWHHLFGRGIVGTPDNFGKLGQEPTHPELLDYLATRFATHGWSIKETIRFLVTTKTWQLTSIPSAQARKVDPDNRLLSHANTRRLEAEAIRDSLLAVSGTLSPAVFGAPVDGESARRSVYVRVQRNALDPFLRAFDFPEPFSAVGRRDVTNVPAQSLMLMNDPHISMLALNWAGSVLADTSLSQEQDRIQRMFLTALGRRASPAEIIRAKAYLAATQADHHKMAARIIELRKQRDEAALAIDALLAPARDRLMAQAKSKNADTTAPRLPQLIPPLTLPQPIGRWDFTDANGGLRDLVGTSHGELRNGARLQNGTLTLDGQGYVVTAPLQKMIRERTLEVWVQLDNLSQGGGGVMTIMTPDGLQFDAIVFGEREPQRWMAGSANYARTQSFAGTPETEADKRTVHFALAYHADGRIIGYRDGELYGSGYKSTAPVEFQAGQTVIGFGIRHLPAGGNKMLAGKILRAQLYDRALSAEEIQASSQSLPHAISRSQIIASLSADDRAKIAQQEKQIMEWEAGIKALKPVTDVAEEQSAWTDLARAIFNFKEFIYIN